MIKEYQIYLDCQEALGMTDTFFYLYHTITCVKEERIEIDLGRNENYRKHMEQAQPFTIIPPLEAFNWLFH